MSREEKTHICNHIWFCNVKWQYEEEILTGNNSPIGIKTHILGTFKIENLFIGQYGNVSRNILTKK